MNLRMRWGIPPGLSHSSILANERLEHHGEAITDVPPAHRRALAR